MKNTWQPEMALLLNYGTETLSYVRKSSRDMNNLLIVCSLIIMSLLVALMIRPSEFGIWKQLKWQVTYIVVTFLHSPFIKILIFANIS